MKAVLILLTALVIFAIAWLVIVRYFRNKGKTATVSHLSGFFVGVVLSVMFLVAAAIIDGPTPAAEVSSTSPSPAPNAAPSGARSNAPSSSRTVEPSVEETSTPEATLDITVDQYKKNFDRIMKEADAPFRANFRTKSHSGSSDVVAATLNDHLVILLTINSKSKKITSVLLSGTGDGTTKSGADIIVVAVAALASVFPDGKSEQVGPTVIDLMQEYKVGDDEPASHVVNGVKLAHMRSKETGVLFSAEPV